MSNKEVFAHPVAWRRFARSDGRLARWRGMADDMARLRERMEAAAAALDFEEARRLRDRINLLRGGAAIDEVETIDTRGLARQRPGRMGLGTSQQRVEPPAGWVPPPKPDLMTRTSRSTRSNRAD